MEMCSLLFFNIRLPPTIDFGTSANSHSVGSLLTVAKEDIRRSSLEYQEARSVGDRD